MAALRVRCITFKVSLREPLSIHSKPDHIDSPYNHLSIAILAMSLGWLVLFTWHSANQVARKQSHDYTLINLALIRMYILTVWPPVGSGYYKVPLGFYNTPVSNYIYTTSSFARYARFATCRHRQIWHIAAVHLCNTCISRHAPIRSIRTMDCQSGWSWEQHSVCGDDPSVQQSMSCNSLHVTTFPLLSISMPSFQPLVQ